MWQRLDNTRPLSADKTLHSCTLCARRPVSPPSFGKQHAATSAASPQLCRYFSWRRTHRCTLLHRRTLNPLRYILGNYALQTMIKITNKVIHLGFCLILDSKKHATQRNFSLKIFPQNTYSILNMRILIKTDPEL